MKTGTSYVCLLLVEGGHYIVIDGYILYKVSNFDNLENLIIFSITDQSKELETNMFLCTLNMMCHMNFPDFFLIQVGILRL